MQVVKWETKDVWALDKEQRQKLEAEGWEPVAVHSQNELLYKRPSGYIEVEEKVVKEKEEIKPEQVITREVSYSLDEVKKVEPEKPSQEIQRRIDNREFDIEM